jgi:hypothetical protein
LYPFAGRVGRTAIAQLSKSCGSNPLGVRVPHPPLCLTTCFTPEYLHKPMPLFSKKNQHPEIITPEDLAKKIQSLEEKLTNITAELEQLKTKNKQTFTKIGVIRFNPFKEIGGNQSFAVALLNEKKDGIIITSYYGRDLNRVYAKEVKNGASEHVLSEEERQAINQAIGSKSSKKQASDNK